MTATRPYTRWTHRRRVLLDDLMARGYSNERAAVVLGTTPAAIPEACKVYGIARPFRQGYTLNRLRALLGVGQRALERWRDEGRIRMRRTGATIAGKRCWMTSHADLFAFLDDPRHWHCWEWERIRDAGLRRYCRRLRGHVVYLSSSEAAYEIGISQIGVNKAIVEGRLPARRDGILNRVLWEDVERYQAARS